MKFVIRSILFVNLLLQMTNSLRSCFDHDQNIMITIILLAFSVIGLIGLVIGNRFILIIFSASMTLILIASITIYAIGRSEEDFMKPKVPYYTNLVPEQDAYARALGKSSQSKFRDTDNKLRSLVDKWLDKNNDIHNDQGRHRGGRYNNKTRANSRQQQPKAKSGAKRYPANQSNLHLLTTTIPSALLDELSDEPTSATLTQDGILTDSALRSLAQSKDLLVPNQIKTIKSLPIDSLEDKRPDLNENNIKKILREDQIKHDLDETELDGAVGERVENEQWIAYERHLYERYLNIVSQSIDLIMHTILAGWMALLLDEDSDQCFGPKTSSGGRKGALSGVNRRGSGIKEPPVYNYNGVRYSIRPDVDDSPAHIVVH